MKKILMWAPRVLSVLFIIFISLFALDSFETGLTLMNIIGFFIHLIPTYILIALTFVSIKWPRIGGSIFILLGLFYIYMTRQDFDIIVYLLIPAPAFLIGGLYIANSFVKEAVSGRVNTEIAKKSKSNKKKS